MNAAHIVKCISCGKYNDDLVDGICVNCEVAQETSNITEMGHQQNWEEYNDKSSVLDDICNIIEDCEDDFPIPKNPCVNCGQDEMYSEKLTRGLCLNCYHQEEDDRKMLESECEHDMYLGLI